MNSLKKNLVFIGLPLLLLVAVALLFRGNDTSENAEFQKLDSDSPTAEAQQERYAVGQIAPRAVELPKVNLEFLAIEESMQDVAGTTTEEQTDNQTVASKPRSTIDESIPLKPARGSKNSESQAGASLNRGQIDRAVAKYNIADNEKENVASVLFTEDGPFTRGGGTFGSGKDGPISILAPGSDDQPEQSQTAPPKIRTANAADGRLNAERKTGPHQPFPSETSSPQPIRINSSQTVVAQQNSNRPLLAPGEELISEEIISEEIISGETVDGSQTSTLPPAIETQIRQRLDYGTSLAKRGAFASSEDIYLQVIRLIAETKDSQLGTRQHTQDLADGLTAFEEAQDFMSTDLRTRVRLDVASIVQTHSTTLLHGEDCEMMSTIQALQRYYEYVSDQFVKACESEPVASEALYYLGKLYATNSQFDPADSAMQNAKSMIMQQAALETDGNNHRASNELGVLLARYGRFPDARDMLIHSVSIQPDSVAWRNLARVHEKLGEVKLSQLAMNESRIVMEQDFSSKSPKSNAMIQWVAPQQLAAIGGKQQQVRGETMQAPAEPAVQVSEKPASSNGEPWWKVWKR